VPCTVLSSEVKAHHDPDVINDTYSVSILYGYEFNGHQFQADNYNVEGFQNASSIGHDGKQAVVDRFPPGTRTVCYVNPAAPAEAVLNRGLPFIVLVGLLPLGFALIGGSGLVFTLKSVYTKIPADPMVDAPKLEVALNRRAAAVGRKP